VSDRLTPLGLALCVVTAICGGIGIALMKSGLAAEPLGLVALLGGLAAYGTGVGCGIVLLGAYPLSLAYPVVVGLSLAVLAVTSALWLGEALTLPRIAGTVFVFLGVLLLVGPAAPRKTRT
jgi:multidrug transporter EmrE-like cation transporter